MDRLERKEAEDTVSREIQITRAVKTGRLRMELSMFPKDPVVRKKWIKFVQPLRNGIENS